MGAADGGHQRDLGWLHRRWKQDGHRLGSQREGVVWLVPGQDPEEVAAQFKRFVTSERLPAGATVEFQDFTRLPGISNTDSTWVRCASHTRRRARQAGNPDGLRRFDPPGRDIASQRAGTGYPADGLWPRRRSGAQPQREVRAALLPPRHPPCTPACWPSSRGGEAAGASLTLRVVPGVWRGRCGGVFCGCSPGSFCRVPNGA